MKNLVGFITGGPDGDWSPGFGGGYGGGGNFGPGGGYGGGMKYFYLPLSLETSLTRYTLFL